VLTWAIALVLRHHVARGEDDAGCLDRRDHQHCGGCTLPANQGARGTCYVLMQTMYKGVERDDQRQREKRQRMEDLARNRERETALRQLQPIPDRSPQRLA